MSSNSRVALAQSLSYDGRGRTHADVGIAEERGELKRAAVADLGISSKTVTAAAGQVATFPSLLQVKIGRSSERADLSYYNMCATD